MREVRDILSGFAAARRAGLRSALATLVHVEGSSYRRPGARALFVEDGSIHGGISGGCVERDLQRRARIAIGCGRPRVVRYETGAEETDGPGASLGCGGAIEVFLEPLTGGSPEAMDGLRRGWEDRSPTTTALVVRSITNELPTGFRCSLEDAAELGDVLPATAADGAAGRELCAMLQRPLEKPSLIHTRWGDVFVDRVTPPLELRIFGAGPDVIPLVSFGRALGWRVTVVDLRSGPSAPAGAIEADEHIGCSPLDLGVAVRGVEEVAVVLMTHNFRHDLLILAAMQGSDPPYLGVLGPRARTERLLAELDTDARAPTACRAKIHFPIGLDLGADAPEGIALAIVSEIVAVRNGRPAGFLRDRDGALHGRRVSVPGSCQAPPPEHGACPTSAS